MVTVMSPRRETQQDFQKRIVWGVTQIDEQGRRLHAGLDAAGNSCFFIVTVGDDARLVFQIDHQMDESEKQLFANASEQLELEPLSDIKRNVVFQWSWKDQNQGRLFA